MSSNFVCRILSSSFAPLWISGHCPVCPSLCFCRSSGQGPMRVEWRWVWWVWSGKLPDTTPPYTTRIPGISDVTELLQSLESLGIFKLALTQWRLGLAWSCWITHDRPLLWQESTVSSSNLSWPLFAKLLLIYFEFKIIFACNSRHRLHMKYIRHIHGTSFARVCWLWGTSAAWNFLLPAAFRSRWKTAEWSFKWLTHAKLQDLDPQNNPGVWYVFFFCIYFWTIWYSCVLNYGFWNKTTHRTLLCYSPGPNFWLQNC